MTTATNLITSETIDGTTYYSATRRGVLYTAYLTSWGDWWVGSQRLALGAFHVGGGKHYKSLSDLSAKCKAFAGLELLLSSDAVVC